MKGIHTEILFINAYAFHMLKEKLLQLGSIQVLGCKAMQSSFPKRAMDKNRVDETVMVGGNKHSALYLLLFFVLAKVNYLWSHPDKRGDCARNLYEVV